METIISYLIKEFNPMNNLNRISWIDAAKGLAMLIIIWGHVQTASPLKTWLCSFHVPLFLVLTGILLARQGREREEDGRWKSEKRLIYKVLRPYLSFSIIAIICRFAYALIVGELKSGIEVSIINIYKTMTGFGIGAIWFIPSYFIACYAYNITKRYRIITQFFFLLIWAAIGIGGSQLFTYLKDVIEQGRVYDAIYYPICALTRGLACTFFVVFGRILYEIYNKTHGVKSFPWLLVVVSILSLLINIYISQYLAGTNFSFLRLGKYPYLSFVCGSFGSISIIGFFYLMRHLYTFQILQFIGRKSLIIMGTHMSLLLTLLVPRLLNLLVTEPVEQTINYYLYGVACVVIIVLIEIPIIMSFDGKLNFLIRRPGDDK